MVRFPAPSSARSNTGTSPSASSRITASTARILGLVPSRNSAELWILAGNSIFAAKFGSILTYADVGRSPFMPDTPLHFLQKHGCCHPVTLPNLRWKRDLSPIFNELQKI